jgi:diaminohydroxyphosphoribosylaminopyrimidine deaminase/5-amino-6-(5-phosphoribosylamino)uracil reductase
MQDPNPLVSGNGIARLRAAGIEVECGLMAAAARELNIGFVRRMECGLPWVRSKIAASLDGRTALANGVSQWITGPEARQDVQRLRARSCAVLTGIGTVLADDPQLNVRDLSPPLTKGGWEGLRQPLRVVVDSQLRMPPNAKVLRPSPGGIRALIYTIAQDAEKIAALEAAGAQVVVLSDAQGCVDLSAVLRDLAVRGVNELLVEAGATLNGALLKAGLVDELVLYLAPQLLGDAARGLAALGELVSLDQRIALAWQDVRQVGGDLRLTARIQR